MLRAYPTAAINHSLRIFCQIRHFLNPNSSTMPAACTPHLRYDCITFDMDGTLTEDGAIDFHEMRSRARIPPGSDILQHISTLSGSERERAQSAIAQVEAEGRGRTRLNDGCVELLQALHASHVPLAILTRNNQEALEWTLQRFALEPFFPPNLRISRDFCGRPKPHPDGLLHIASLCGVRDMKRMLMVGDWSDDIDAGAAAGCNTCLLKYEKNSHVTNAHMVVTSLRQLMEILVPSASSPPSASS
jgi:HAD superfamily hydrolase (TIGR01549 family)